MDASYLMTFVSSVRAIPSVTATLTRRSQQWTKEVKSEISKSSSGPFCFFWSATFSKQIWNITDTQFLVLQTAVLREAGLKFVHNVAWRISFHFIQKKKNSFSIIHPLMFFHSLTLEHICQSDIFGAAGIILLMRGSSTFPWWTVFLFSVTSTDEKKKSSNRPLFWRPRAPSTALSKWQQHFLFGFTQKKNPKSQACKFSHPQNWTHVFKAGSMLLLNYVFGTVEMWQALDIYLMISGFLQTKVFVSSIVTEWRQSHWSHQRCCASVPWKWDSTLSLVLSLNNSKQCKNATTLHLSW